MSKHTKEFLSTAAKMTTKSVDIYADDGSLIAECLVNGAPESRQANARRIAACWNACDGIPTETLERYYGDQGGIDAAGYEASLKHELAVIHQRDELLVALDHLVQICDCFNIVGLDVDEARAAIAKVTGGAV